MSRLFINSLLSFVFFEFFVVFVVQRTLLRLNG